MKEKTTKQLEFESKIASAARMTWDAIGDDCLVNEDGYPDETVTMTREEVIEMVSDADRMMSYGNLTKEEMQEYYNLSREEQNWIMLKAFPHKIYGW